MTRFIVLSQIIYQDHHLLINVLNQNGHVYTLLCLGGQGSSKKQLGKKIDIGHILEVNALKENHKTAHLYLKEFEVIWSPWKIRNNYQAWCILNFFLEVSLKVASSKELNIKEWEQVKLENNNSKEYEVLVKFLFWIEELAQNKIDNYQTSSICLFFLVKVLTLQGMIPIMDKCYICESDLTLQNIAVFHQPNFLCTTCNQRQEWSVNLWRFMNFARHTKYETLRKLALDSWQHIESSSQANFFDQIFAMLHLSKQSIRSYSLISK